MSDYIEREKVLRYQDELEPCICRSIGQDATEIFTATWDSFLVNYIQSIPASDVVEEANILKFYYVRSIDEYWIGQRIDNFYYAEYDPKRRQWVWTHSRYLPWGEHVVSPTSLWKEHTYPSEPEEIPFEEWLEGFIKKYAADVRPVKRGKWVESKSMMEVVYCSECGFRTIYGARPDGLGRNYSYCPNCGADMREVLGDE